MKGGAPAGGGGEGLPVVRVRKYGNRRMYDLERKQYVALDEVARLVHEGRAVRVEDVSTGEDLTRATLVQALVEARGLARFLSDEAVVGLLRLDDERLGEVLGRGLEQQLRTRASAPAHHEEARAETPLSPSAAPAHGENARISQLVFPGHAIKAFGNASAENVTVDMSVSNKVAGDFDLPIGSPNTLAVPGQEPRPREEPPVVSESRRGVTSNVAEPRWPTPVWPAPGAVGFGQGPPAGVYAAQPAVAPPGLSEEVRSLRGEIDALRTLLERAVRGGR